MFLSGRRFYTTQLQKFLADGSGGITAFTAMIFSFMLLAFGMGVDFMRHETLRAELQNAVDRGLLAAAATDQQIDLETTVRSYVRSTNFVDDGYSLSVNQTNPNGLKQVSATASYDMPTVFLKLAGINSIPIVANGSAVEGIDTIELSLILDVSTSMSYNTTGGTSSSRLDVMKTAAKQFVDLVISNSPADKVTVNLVPFAGQVNPGSVAFNKLRSSTVHNYSNCIEFTNSDYSSATLPSDNSRAQMQYFQFSKPWNRSGGVTFPEVGWGWCPGGDEEEIVYYSSNIAVLQQAIDDLNTHEATGTQNGMKWGVSLLDPSSNGLTSSLVTANDVEAKFSGLPRSYNDAKNKKYVVVMTDGNTTQQLRLKSWYYDSSSERSYWASNLSSSQGTHFQYNTTSTSAARTQFLNVCQAAKDAGIVVFTIGFDISNGSAAQSDMTSCASSPSHFYDVDGLQLNTAFSSIVATIQKLKLTN